MALVTDYATLQTEIARILNKSNLNSDIQNFIQRFEARARRDKRLIQLVNGGEIPVGGETFSLPAAFYKIEELSHVGSTRDLYGPIKVTSEGELMNIRGRIASTGAPTHVAVGAGVMRFAPIPDQTYNLRFSYWRKITNLSATNTTNWLLQEHPDIYIYGSLAESAPFLKNDKRLAVWEEIFRDRADALEEANELLQFSGRVAIPFTPIGG